MLNVFGAEKLQIKLSDGRMMLLEDLVRDYESLLKEKPSKKTIASEMKEETSKKAIASEMKEETSKKAIASEMKEETSKEAITFEMKEETSKEAITSKLKVGEWFRIDREIIGNNKKEICRKCKKAGIEGKELWERFEESNKIADKNPDQYPRLIETYIFPHEWEYKTEQEMRDMCEKIGDGMCCEVICDLELQMRICNGEPVDDLVKKSDKLTRTRVIKLKDGGTGYFGGGTDSYYNDPPAELYRNEFLPNNMNSEDTPYAFRRVLS